MPFLHFISLFWRLLVCMKNKSNSKFYWLIILIRTKTIHSYCGQMLRREPFYSRLVSPTPHSQLLSARARCVLSLPCGSVETEAPGGPCAADPVNRNRQEPSTPPGGHTETPAERQLTGSTPQAGQAERPRPTRYKAPHSLSYFFSLVNSLVNISC